MYKIIVLAAVLAVANATGGLIGYGAPAYATAYASPSYAAPAYGYASAPAAITSQSSNILRSPGNLGQVSTYTKTIDTPYSSVSKSDVRVSNPGYATYAAPAYAPAAYAAHSYAPAAYAAPAYAAHSYAPAAYAAPAYARSYAAPAVAAYSSPAIGVAYSAAPAVAHVSYDGLAAHYVY